MRKNFIHYAIAFLLPILIFSFALFSLNIYPFGNISLRFSDSLMQYPAFFEGLRNFKIFTFNIGLGESFYPIFTTYLNNPLNLLYFLFRKENFDLFFVILTLIKFGLMGLTMNILLNYRKKLSKSTLIFSTIYALSGFATFYYWNYQFLDAMYLLPLIMIGIDKIVNDDKNLMYYGCLTYMIIIHYYTAYMCCIFAVIYFFYLLYNSNYEKKIKKQRIVKFFVTSLFCGLTASYIIIPTIFSLFQGRNSYLSDVNFWQVNDVFLPSIYNFFMGSTTVKENVNLLNSANLYISMFVFVLVMISIFYSKMNRQYKKSTLFVIIIYILSLFLYPLYYIWHLFQQPVGIPSRFIFCFNAFWVLIAYNFFIKKDKHYQVISKKVLIIIVIFLVCSFLYKSFYYNFDNDKIYIWLFIINLFMIIYYFFNYNNSNLRFITYFIIILELTINIIMNINVNYQNIYYRYTYVNEDRQKIIDISNLINNLQDNNNFLRIHTTLNKNGGLLYNFNGVGRYSSIYNNNLNNFLYNFRDNNEYNHSINYNSHFLMDALLGVKYVINESTNKYLTNKYIINSLGFLISEQNVDVIDNLINNKELKSLEPVITLENVIEKENCYELNDSNTEGKVIFMYNINENIIGKINLLNNYLIYSTDDQKNVQKIIKYEDTYKLYLNDEEISDIYSLIKGDIVKLEIFLNEGQNSTPKFDNKLEYINEEKFKLLIDDLNSNIINEVKINFRGFSGNVSATDDKNLLVLTIPYDEGIEIKIDGEKVDYFKFKDSIIGLKLIKGEHKIEMVYHIKGFTIGVIFSLIGIIGFIFYLKSLKKCIFKV